MRPTLTMLLLALLLQACGPLRQMQKVQSQIPILGSIGKHRSSLFEKDFHKMGEPRLDRPISVAIESVPFSKSMKSQYEKYRKHMGMEALAKTMDSTKIANLSYFQLEISDVVHLVEQLNSDKNSNLKKYLQEDVALVLLSSVSFIPEDELSQKLGTAEKMYLSTDGTGALVLSIVGGIHEGYAIKQSALQVFDFKRANFCWNMDKRGRMDIAQILLDGGTCPGNTKANPEQLNKTPDYLKL